MIRIRSRTVVDCWQRVGGRMRFKYVLKTFTKSSSEIDPWTANFVMTHGDVLSQK